MERKASLEQVFRFAEFEVNPRAGELRKLGVRIKLQEHPLQVLAMLLEHPGEVVTREELQQRIWPADTFVDFESGLNKAINKLRVSLGDSAENPRFVETLPRHGYRFIGIIDRVVEDKNGLEAASPPLLTSPPLGGCTEAVHATQSPPTEPTSGRPGEPTAQRRQRLRWVAVLASASILAALIGSDAGGLKYRLFGGPAAGRIRSIAVLPLETLSRDPDQEYFAEGMTEALITDLGKIGELRVISRTSVMRYKGTKKSLQEIARELQVDALVEGTVTRSGDRVRITANLVQASPEKHLWADSFERDLRDALALQDHVSLAIANGIRIKLTPKEQSRLRGSQPVDPDAIEAYLKGQFELSRSEFDQSIEHFKEAVLKDPNYAQAWAGLAAAYDALSYPTAGWPSKFRPNFPAESPALHTPLLAKAKAAAIRALQLDESLSEAHVSLGQVLMDLDWSWGAAETEFQRAIALDHSNAVAHREYGGNLMAWGRLNEAVAELNRASALDPFSSQTQVFLARTFSAAGRYDEALQHWREAIALGDPLNYQAHRRMAIAYEGKGMEREAVAELVAAAKAFTKEHGSRLLQDLATVIEQKYVSSGYAEAKKTFIRGDLRASAKAWNGPIWMAADYAELGENDKAFEWLNKTILTNNPNRKFIKTDDRLKALRTDPRFRDLVHNLGFPPIPGDNSGSATLGAGNLERYPQR